MTISEVIDLADSLGICVKDDKLNSYIGNNPYLWLRIKEVSYKEARNVYDYRIGNKPFSTQHKTKGLEYNNVLVILKSNWSNYDFASLFYDNGKKNPSYSEQRNFSMFAVQERRNAWSFIIRRHPIK